MLMDRIKNWLKLLALWAWVHFITLLASDPDSVPKLKYVTEKDEIIILADETTDVDKIKFKKKKKKKSVKDLNEGNEDEPVSKHLDVKLEESNDLDNEEISNEEKVRKSAENESLDKSHLEEEEEKEEKEEEFDIPWLGVGRGTGLTRYSGIQNLLDTNNTAEEPLVIERRQPVLIPRRDGPLVLQRPSFGRSLSHEKERLSEIPEEEKQSPPSFNDDVSNDSDKLWASLVARYGKEEEKDKNNVQNEISGKKDRNTDVEVLQQPIFTSPDESISSEEFSTQVEERLQRYLSKIDEQKLLDERSMEIDNFADETETMDRETEEINEYEVDSGNFDENGRLGNENKILILIEDDDSNEEKEENLDRNYDEVIVPDENFSNENFEINFKEDNKRLKVINEEEEEAVSDYDDIQFDSRSNFITSADTSLATEFQSTGNKDKSSATILDSELMSLATDSSDYIKCEDDYYQYQENVSDEEEIIEEEIPAVFTISLHKKTETLLPFKNDDGTSTLERESVLNRESPIFDQEVLNKTDLSNSEKQVKNVSVADKKVDSSSDFPTNERRQSRDLWKMDCEKMLGEQESPHSQSLEEREDFIFTTYDEFPEDCVPVAEGLLAITEKFGFPLDVETPNDEEEDDSIVDNVFEEPKVPVDNEEFDIFFSEIVPDEESVDKQTDPDFYENLKYNYFIPEIESQEEELKTANLNNDFREASELKTNRITDLPDVTEVEKLATTVEESHSKGISLELKNVNTDQVNVINFVQYDETVAGLDYVNIMTQEAYAMDGNIEVDTLEKEVREVLKSDYEEMETCIEVEPIREKCSFPVMLEKNLSASCEDSFSVTLSEEEQIGKTLGTEMTIDVENATSSEHLLEKVVKEEPVLNIMHHELCDVEMDDSTLETTESVSHFMLEVHAESKLDDSRELETLKESKQVQILEQMKEEKPKEDIDSVTAKYAENKFETKNCDASVAFADKENSNACLENLDAEKFNNDLLKQKMKETLQDKETMYNIPPLNEPVTLSVDISYKQNESLPELPSNEQKKKTVAKVKKGKLDNILKRFEEKEEPVLQKPLPKKRFGVKVKETKPTIEGIENVLVKDHELSAEQKATSSTAISSNKNELADNATQKASKTESLLPTAMDVDKAKACKEETSVFNHNKNNSQTEQAMIKDISEIQSSNDDLNEEIFSSENISEVVQKITVVEKPSEKQSVVVNELATDSSNTHEKEKLKDVILAVSIKEEMCESNKMEVADSLCTTDEENFELASKQADTKGSAPTKTSETKAEVAESVAVDPPSDNIVTVTIPRRKKLQIPKNFEEISEPQKMVKTAVKKGKLNNILNKFEAKECKQIATKALPKLDSNSKAFVIESKDLVVSLNNQHPKEVHDEELKMSSTSVKESSFPAEDGSKEMDIVINEKQASTIAEAADEHMRFDPENVKNLEKPALDSAKDCLLASLESSTVILDNEQDSTVKFKEEIEAAATIISKADTSFIEKELNETFLEIDQSEKSSSEKEFFRFNVKDDKTLLNKIKSTSLLDLGPEIPPEQIIEDDESYYVLDEIQQQQTSLTVEDVDADKEKSYWFDDSKNLREADSLHNRKSANGDEPSYWFEEDSNQQEEDASTFWFEEDAANKIEDEAVPNKGNEDNIYKVETFKSVDTIETKKRHSYFSEDDDDLYFLKKTDTEKPFTEEKDEELALLRKETMELSKPKKIKKDYEDTESARESSFTDNLKSSEISEEDRLEKERILCAIRNEREVSKSGVIPEDEIPDYLDDVKDLLVPKVRRKKGRKSRALDDLMKVEEPDFTSKAMVISKKVSRYEQPLTTEDQANVAAIDAQRARLDPEFASSIVKKDSEPNSNKFLTVEEERELIEIQREQEALRASQRKELEKYLSMPAALTEQEQNELEELLAEQETDRVVNAVSEARLEALLNEVRKRIGDSELDLETAAALEEYIGLPIGLTIEEELLLSNIGEEKDRSQFASDDEYRDYIKQRYLDELEDERMRVEEDEYEFGGYYEDDYEYDGDEDYDEEYMEEDYDMMEGDNTPLTPTMKDEAIGGDEPMNLETGEGEEGVELKKSKNLLSSLSSLRSKGSKSSSGSLDKPGSNYSSKEGSSSDLQNESSHTQSKKFFRYGGLSIKRKKKIKDYSEIDLGIKNECIDTNDVSDNANKDGLSKSIKMFIKNEDSCDCDEAFVIIPKDICKSITNLCANESVEIAHCQDLPKNKIDSSSVISSSLLNEPNSNELLAQKSDHVGKGISNCIDPTLHPLLHPECVLEENDSQDDLNETTPRTSTDMNITHEKCCSSVIDSSLSEKWEVIDSKERACLKPSNCEIPNIFITDASNITTKIFGLLKQKNVQQRNILPLSQIQNTMSIPFNIDVNTKKRAVNLQRDGKRDDSMKPGTVIGASEKYSASEPIESLDNHFSLVNETSHNKDTPSGKSCVIVEAKLKVSKMSEVTSSGPDAMDEEELWPEEGDGKKEDLDEFQKMEQEVEREMEEEQKKKKKPDTDKRGKKKKKRKGESEKENKKTAYQSKDELYEKHVGPRIRSFDAAKMKSKFNKPKEPTQVSNDCRICGKLVFQMEKIVAEKASWHKNCFRCTECNKNLTLETYQSHEGSLYCKPHFKELFRPKAVVQDEAEERKDRLLRRPRMIILESQPELLPDDVVRATEKPDYGLDELQTSLNVKERFAVFESYSKAADEPKLEPVSVRRSQSLMSKAARFSNGHQNGDNEDEEEEYESGEEMEEGEEEGDEEGGEEEDPNHVKSRKKKERPMSFSGMGDLKAVWEQKQRREEMSQARKEDISKFRQMLCAGKNITLKEMFESGNFEGAEDEEKKSREEIKIEDRRSAHNLKARFEKGQPFILEDEEGSEDGSKTSTLVGEKQEVEEVFKDAQTAKQARNVFKQIDSKVAQEGSVILRSPSFAAQNRDNRRSLDISLMMPQRSMSTAEVVKSSQPVEEELQMDTTDLANRFKFFSTFEERQKEETEKKRKVFRITPPREGAEQGLSHGADDSEVLGRDPNLIKCTDNYQDDIDCRNTKNILQMFKKMEMGEEEEEEEEGPRPLKCFTPPPEDGEGDESDYTDEEYSDEGEEEESEEDDDGKPKFKDELLEMEACPQSARKAANLRAKFEKWEERQNELNRDKDNELEEECRPSLDSARNLTAMFEHKAIEVTKPVTSKPVAQKINRFVGGGGEKCMACDKTVYAMEKLEIHGKILHKNCFKCFKCNSRLSMGSFSFGGEQMFCTTHYKQLFTEKGSYDAFLSGKDKWTSKIEATNAEAIKSHD